MAIYHQYQPPHQMHSMFAKFDRLLDMMESRMDAVDRRVENLRRKQYPSPHQSGRSRNIPDGFFSRHPEDAANRCIGYPRAPPLREPPPHPTPSPPYAQRTRRSYLPLSQPPPARSSSSGYTARHNAHQLPLNASTPGDQFVEQEQPPRQPHCVRKSPKPGWFSQESHQQRFLPPKKQTCWDLPVPRQYVGSPVSDAPPARPTWRWDQPETRIRQRVSAYEPPPPTGWPPRPQPSSVRQPTCWDPPEQQGYPPHEPPPRVEPLDRECAKFRRLSQQLQPHRYRNEVDKDRCYGEVITHTYSPTLDVSLGSYVSGYANELTGHKEVDSYLSSLDVQIAYSYSDCVDDRGKGEEELCDSKDSIFETAAKEAMDRGLPSENKRSMESRDGRPEDQQVSSFVKIFMSCSLDMSTEKEEKTLLKDVEEDDYTNEVKKVVASLSVVQVPSKNVVGNCWSRKGDGAYTGLPVIACVYVDLNVGDVPSLNLRSTSLDTDARLISPRNDTPCLSILRGVNKLFILAWNFADNIGSPLLIFDTGDKGRHSAVRYVFDPGGDALLKLLLSTLVNGSWFPP